MMIWGLVAWFIVGTMSDMAVSVRIWASSRTRMRTLAKPRMPPRSRAAVMMRDPFLKMIASWPAVRITLRMWGLMSGSSQIDMRDWKDSLATLVAWAVQATVVFGWARHWANAYPRIKCVFPACLAMENATVSCV